MTGYAQTAAENGRRRLEAVVQGWNHRNLDVVLRLPEELRGLESELRERLATVAARGRCELAVRSTGLAPRVVRVKVEREAISALLATADELAAEGWIERSRPTVADLLRTPGLLRVEDEPDAWDESDRRLLDQVVGEALAAFDVARRGEGERMRAALACIGAALREGAGELARRRATIAGQLEETLRRRLDELVAGGAAAVPPERLAQEVVLLVERGDVREELDRLRSHLDHLEELLAASTAVGKRLEFLAQEILRELNTLGAKSRDAELTRLVVDAKVHCEQLREQIQNVE